MLDNKKIKIVFFMAIALLVLVAVALFVFGARNPKPEEVELEFWGVFDDSDIYSSLIEEFQEKYPHITIKYRKKTYENYEDDLLEAMATRRGPDILMIDNNWLPSYKDKIVPAPNDLISLNELENSFVDVVVDDFVKDKKVYALPLYVDTLALYYNKDIFNSAGIISPPKTWEEFMDAVEKITTTDNNNNINRAGAAIGTAKNVNRSVDILSLLMLQSGSQMVNDNKTRVTFDKPVELEGKEFFPTQRALAFYTDFSNPLKSVYTWNRDMHYSLDAFYEGKAAMMFNYAYHVFTIQGKSPYLNFDVAPMPQINGNNKKINYANYWGLAVSNNSRNPETAWNFINWIINKKENNKAYLEKTNRPTARRDLIRWQKEDEDIGIFAEQSLTAQSWYQVDPHAVENYFANMIQSVVLGQDTIKNAISKAANKINLIMEKNN